MTDRDPEARSPASPDSGGIRWGPSEWPYRLRGVGIFLVGIAAVLWADGSRRPFYYRWAGFLFVILGLVALVRPGFLYEEREAKAEVNDRIALRAMFAAMVLSVVLSFVVPRLWPGSVA